MHGQTLPEEQMEVPGSQVQLLPLGPQDARYQGFVFTFQVAPSGRFGLHGPPRKALTGLVHDATETPTGGTMGLFNGSFEWGGKQSTLPFSWENGRLLWHQPVGDDEKRTFYLVQDETRIKAVTGYPGGEGVWGLSWATVPWISACLLYTSPSPRDGLLSRMPSSA